MTDSIRLAKRVADAVPCSRREAEQYIEGGWVTVDGVVIEEPGHRVSPQQAIHLSPDATLVAINPVTILLHKPAGIDADAALRLITPENLYAEDRSGIRFLKKHTSELKPVDVLETYASGLMVFTQDWHVARKLVDDAATVEQEYIAEVSGDLIPNGLALLNHGLNFNGKPLAPIKVSWQNETRLRFALKAGRRGQIAHMCEMVGLKLLNLKRIRIARLPMASLPAGQWRYLKGYERF
ncbi:putative ribosomal large subunit pseudouridine synthase [Herminiimonas arsenicoxydans]|uniref:Dual-specificity RNA pseudouridine synthase RluF n=1 Tax=Herminiimonas arsenicoxydans TaxID=204773 RepID=A4G409_HERAR|nr:putative ribosomal large subunit pseudouridine synthase [Herminiimonas arsenicoxydans]